MGARTAKATSSISPIGRCRIFAWARSTPDSRSSMAPGRTTTGRAAMPVTTILFTCWWDWFSNSSSYKNRFGILRADIMKESGANEMTLKSKKTKMHLRAIVLSLMCFGFVALASSSWSAGHARSRKTSQNSANTGQIAGKIFFEGARPKLAPLDMGKDPVCVSEQAGTVTAQDGAVNDNDTLPNAFVY